MVTKRIVRTASVLTFLLSVVAQAQSEKVDMKLVLSQGQSFTLTLTSTGSGGAGVEGKASTTVDTLTMGLRFTVMEVVPNGPYRLKVTINNLSSSIAGTGQSDGVLDAALGKALSAFNGQSFELRLSRGGLVTSISGLDSVMRAAAENIASYPELVRMVVMMFLSRVLGEPAWRQGLSEIFSVLPSGPVAIGERWSRMLSVGGQGYRHESDVYCKILDRSNGTVKIKVYHDIKSHEMSFPLGIGVSLKGTAEGVFDVEESTGLAVRGTISSTMKGSGWSPDAPGKKTPVTATSATTFSRS